MAHPFEVGARLANPRPRISTASSRFAHRRSRWMSVTIFKWWPRVNLRLGLHRLYGGKLDPISSRLENAKTNAEWGLPIATATVRNVWSERKTFVDLGSVIPVGVIA